MFFLPLNADTLEYYEKRVEKVERDTPRLWGKLTPERILRHLRESIEVSLGRVEVEDKSSFFSRTVLKGIVFYLMPDKKNIVVPGQEIPAEAGRFDGRPDEPCWQAQRWIVMRRPSPRRGPSSESCRTRKNCISSCAIRRWSCRTRTCTRWTC